jgi:hypothetical protein
MGKPRVRGSHAKIAIKIGTDVFEVGEVSKFSVKELGELKKSRAIGEQEVTSNKTFEGYDLSFEGGKVDWSAAALLHSQDLAIKNGKAAPYFQVTQQITYYGATNSEVYTYENVTLHGYNMDIDANDEIMEKFEGFCGTVRKRDPEGTNGLSNVKAQAAIDALISAQITKRL